MSPSKPPKLAFLQLVVDEQRLADRLRDDFGGLARTHKRARGDEIDRTIREDARRLMRLRDAARVERNIGVTLEAALGVPVGLPVPQEIEGASGYRHAQPANTGMRGADIHALRPARSGTISATTRPRSVTSTVSAQAARRTHSLNLSLSTLGPTERIRQSS